jgi:hypothetical protein
LIPKAEIADANQLTPAATVEFRSSDEDSKDSKQVLLWIMSDLHLESTRGWDLPAPAARPAFDVMIVAGDLIPRMERGVEFLAERVTDKDTVVLYLAGNHEAMAEISIAPWRKRGRRPPDRV